jgi:hypothetical protein
LRVYDSAYLREKEKETERKKEEMTSVSRGVE